MAVESREGLGLAFDFLLALAVQRMQMKEGMMQRQTIP
jgi:hypothetical protein